jgi:hypothetical protein
LIEIYFQVRNKADPSTLKYLTTLMDEVEKQKAALGSIDDGKIQVGLLAVNLFEKADTEFRSGRADKKTFIKFRAASILMVMLPHSLPPHPNTRSTLKPRRR